MNSLIDLLMVIFIGTLMVLVFAGMYQITFIIYNYIDKRRNNIMYLPV